MNVNTCCALFFLGLTSAGATSITPGVGSCPNGTISFTSTGLAPTWDKCGNATGMGAAALLDSTNVATDASADTLESFLKLSAGTLNPTNLKITPARIPGTAIAQAFSNTAGGQISFDSIFNAEPGAVAAAFFVANGSLYLLYSQQVFLGAPTQQGGLAPLPANHTVLPLSPGTYSIGFGIVGGSISQFIDPQLTVSNLVFTAAPGPGPGPGPTSVPEPATVLGTGLGLALFAHLRRRARGRTAPF